MLPLDHRFMLRSDRTFHRRPPAITGPLPHASPVYSTESLL